MQDRRSELLAIFETSADLLEGSLNLNNKLIKNEDMEVLCEFLESHPEIKKLDLSENPINDLGIRNFIALNDTIEDLNISDCIISGIGFSLLAHHERLGSVNASKIIISDQGAIAFAKNNQSISELDISNSCIFPDGVKALVANDALKVIHINQALLSSRVKSALAETDLYKKVNDARQFGFKKTVPSLLELSAYTVSKLMEKCSLFANKANTTLPIEAKDEVQAVQQKHSPKVKHMRT